MANLLSVPSLSGTMLESSAYQILGSGLTDTILLMGHADADIMYEPYRVTNAKNAVAFLGKDSQSPLLRAFLEVYNCGCKDIWLYPVAPMSEYEPTIADRLTPRTEWGSKTFYEKYYDRLTVAYSALSGYDFPEIIVPVEAVFYDAGDVDFLTQLVDFCGSFFTITGAVCFGVLGTRISAFSDQSIIDMTTDERISSLGEAGKFVFLVMGEGLITNPQMTLSYISSLAVKTAAVMATAPLDHSVTGIQLPLVSTLVGNDLSSSKIEELATAKINCATRTTRGKRGYANQVILLTDNTLGQDGSDFWSLGQMRIIANVINQIREYGYAFIGSIYIAKFKEIVSSYMFYLKNASVIKDFTLNIVETNQSQKISVIISLTPVFGLRQITFQVEVGPGS